MTDNFLRVNRIQKMLRRREYKTRDLNIAAIVSVQVRFFDGKIPVRFFFSEDGTAITVIFSVYLKNI